MLRVASFNISAAAGINELLSKYRLAKGASILVSNGEVCIPYEDGEPKNAAQQIVDIKEQQQELRDQLAIVTHSQGVVALQVADARAKYDVAHAEWSKSRSNKLLEAAKDRALAHFEEGKNLQLSNEHEIVRINRNLDLHDLQIEKLSA